MDASIKLEPFGEKFKGRLADNRLKFAMDYIAFNEDNLTLETSCPYACEFDTHITKEERDEITLLSWNFKSPLDNNTIAYLKNLIPNISRE